MFNMKCLLDEIITRSAVSAFPHHFLDGVKGKSGVSESTEVSQKPVAIERKVWKISQKRILNSTKYSVKIALIQS